MSGGHNAQVGAIQAAGGLPGITTIGKNVQIAANLKVERGASISPDVYLEPEPLLWSS